MPQFKLPVVNVTVDSVSSAKYHATVVRAARRKSRPGKGTAFIVSIMSQAAATIPQKLFFKIGEVCEIAGVQAHVLRYWETEFPMLAPQKNRAGQRTYRRRDVEMALRIKELLYDEQYTIAGAKKKLAIEIRAPGKENLQPVQQKQNVRSLQPPPSLAGKFTAPPASANPALSEDQRASLRQVASQLREILNLLEQGDEELEQLRSQSK